MRAHHYSGAATISVGSRHRRHAAPVGGRNHTKRCTMGVFEQVTSGYRLAVAIAVIELTALIIAVVTAVRRPRHLPRVVKPIIPSDVPYERCRALIAEGMIVRDRISGQIDAATYQARMKDLVTGANSS